MDDPIIRQAEMILEEKATRDSADNGNINQQQEDLAPAWGFSAFIWWIVIACLLIWFFKQ